MSNTQLIDSIVEPYFRSIDHKFAEFLVNHYQGCQRSKELALIASRAQADKHTCLSVEQINQCAWMAGFAPFTANEIQHISGVSDGTEPAMLVFEGHYLYLHRYWYFEQQVANLLQAKQSHERIVNYDYLSQKLSHYFGSYSAQPDFQKLAVAVCQLTNLGIITGGPGTGKTTTVTKLMAIYSELFLHGQHRSPHIAMVAPTGKAATRMLASVQQAVNELSLEAEVAACIPKEAQTIHRLLGVKHRDIEFRHNQENPLHYDMVILDESSMVDLAMMYRLLSALKLDCTLILIGDPFQLASVEAGCLLGDIIDVNRVNQYSSHVCQRLHQIESLFTVEMAPNDDICDCNCTLMVSHRFSGESGIGVLAESVKFRDVAACFNVFEQFSDVFLHLISSSWQKTLIQNIQPHIEKIQNAVCQHLSPAEVLDVLNESMVLCAVRKGPFGVDGINYLVEKELLKEVTLQSTDPFYSGKPIMIAENDRSLGLFNGDMGIVLADKSGQKKAYFKGVNGQVLSLYCHRLPKHQTAYAMTIHKSQGSEFDQVLCILPNQATELLTNELLYTAITRAKKRFSLFANKDAIARGITKSVQRSSGLRERLRL